MTRQSPEMVRMRPTGYAALSKLSELSGVPMTAILDALILPEYDAVMAGKTPTYGTRAAGDGGRDG